MVEIICLVSHVLTSIHAGEVHLALGGLRSSPVAVRGDTTTLGHAGDSSVTSMVILNEWSLTVPGKWKC